jgi:hypothetical protein
LCDTHDEKRSPGKVRRLGERVVSRKAGRRAFCERSGRPSEHGAHACVGRGRALRRINADTSALPGVSRREPTLMPTRADVVPSGNAAVAAQHPRIAAEAEVIGPGEACNLQRARSRPYPAMLSRRASPRKRTGALPSAHQVVHDIRTASPSTTPGPVTATDSQAEWPFARTFWDQLARVSGLMRPLSPYPQCWWAISTQPAV